jgi:anhydro-N-acetylmuramic acid kinase
MGGLFIGLMSGTSLDGVDGVVADLGTAVDGASSPVRVLAHVHEPLPRELVREFLALNTTGDNELHRSALAANALARIQSTVVASLLSEAGIDAGQVVAIGAHGQTVRHQPGAFDGTGYTIQLNAPALLAELTGIAVIADFRSRDVAAGGQGAPLVPAFHRAVFGRTDADRAVLNLGGIANLTAILRSGHTIGFDCGPANALMDHWCSTHRGSPYDANGDWAASGVVDEALLARMLSEPYFAQPAPKSTGLDLFNLRWLDAQLGAMSRTVAPADVQATLAELTARSCATDVVRYCPDAAEVLVCGGGSLNVHLMGRIAAHLPGRSVMSTDSRGLPAMQVEACAFAWLARAWMNRDCGNLAEVTGARGPRLLGALYPAV